MDPDATRPRPALPIAGEFELVRKLGSGGFGTVFEARHRATGLPYAVKRVELTTEDADRFRKEALYPARIASQSLHVLSMHSFFQDETEGYFYLVTELIPNGDLRHFMATQPKPLPSTLAIDIALGVARGLAAIHEQGIVHRDMKPGNILMDRKDDRWVPKIADFGLARSSGSVSIGEFASPGYASPEQVDLASEPRLGAESDLFSYGMVLYEVLTGEKASDAKDLREYTRWARERRQPPPLSARRPELPGGAELDALMARLLEFDPDRRTITAGEVARALAGIQQTADRAAAPTPVAVSDAPEPTHRRPALQVPAPEPYPKIPLPAPSPAASPAPARQPARSQGRPLLVGGAVIVVVALVGSAFWMSSGGDAGDTARGLSDFRNQEYARALPALLDAAEEGDAESRSALGRMYGHGWGVQQDFAEAKRWLDQAAGQGNREARCALGDMYRDGSGVEKRPDEALKRYTAAQDAPCGQNGLAHMHLNGLGVPPNYDEALRWYEKAAEKDDDVAVARLRDLQAGWVMEPLFTGAWQSIGGKERRAEIDRLRSAEVLERVRTADVRRMRRLNVDFYEGASVFELEAGRPGGQLGVLTYVRHGDRLVMIDGRAPQIHDLSASAPIRIDTIQRAIAFLRFFMGAIQGDDGIFRIVDSATDLHWLPEAVSESRDPQRLRIQALEVEPSPSGGWRARSTIGYGSSLYRASLWLKPNGMVEMTDDTAVATSLPVAVERFDEDGVRVRVAPGPRS